MNLFEKKQIQNLLPRDGEVLYFDSILSKTESKFFYDNLLHKIQWIHDEVLIFGKNIITKRKVAWYGDKDFYYTYSNKTKFAIEWTEELLRLKKICESYSQTKFNACLLNLYHNGTEGVSWHSDDEKSILENSCIASMSFNAERKFEFRHKKTKEKISLILEDGSLLLMKGQTQKHWQHQLPKSAKISKPRINLTFRTMNQ
jgi:alkylated DNA repair dioxygenase AlkB